MGLDFDETAFRRSLSRYAKSTIYETMRKLDQARREGLEPALLCRDPETARVELERYLSEFRHRHSDEAYNQQVRVLNRVLDYAGHDTIRAKKLPEQPSFPKTLPPDKVRKLVGYRHKEPRVERLYRALIIMGLASGLRRGELHRANVTDLDIDNRRLHIPKPSKRGMVRWIPMPAWAFAPKRPLMAYLNHRQPPDTDRDALFVTRDNAGRAKRVTISGLGGMFGRISRDVGFTVNPTVLRHTMASKLLALGHDITTIQLILGHRKITSTAVYARLKPEDAETLFKKDPPKDPYQATRRTGRDKPEYLPDPYD